MADREKVLNGLEACADRTGALCRSCPYDFEKDSCISDMAKDALELLKEQPEIVRCKNCKYGEPVKNILDEDRYECHLPESYVISDLVLPPDWFCGDGEARQDD